MKFQVLAVSALSCVASASSVGRKELEAPTAYDALDVFRRATAQAPNGYAPEPVDCPSTKPSIRTANGLSSEEKSWLQKRRPNTVQPMKEFLARLDIKNFNASAYIEKHKSNATALPNIGIAFSGGGYRAMLNGGGAFAAFDSRTPGSTGAGQLGGLLQSSTYIAGLSGGGWLLGSIYANNFTSIQNIIDRNGNGDIWQLSNSIFVGPKDGGLQILSQADYYKNLVDTVTSKEESPGTFNVSLTDFWARALAFQFVNATDGGPAFTWSSIQDDDDFKNANNPFPLLVAIERNPGETLISTSATNIEFNPYEMGSYDPTLYGFAPLKYLGSNFTSGQIPNGEQCVRGFDNAGFIMGTSSSLFNQVLLNIGTQDVPAIINNAIQGILTRIADNDDDIADYTPNPFLGFNGRENPSADVSRLTLVDGGEDLQNLPLIPLIQPQRKVDVVFAVDSSADTVEPMNPVSAENWPNGTSLVATFQRTTNRTMQNGTAFPYIPDVNTIVNFGFNNRPAFFGCDANNLTTNASSPIIVYLPNAPYVFLSNTSTFDKLAYSDEERNAMLTNGYNIATMANSTLSGYEDWSTCVGCAIISRSLTRTGTQVPAACKSCFTKYCWNGTLATDTPAPYFPEMKLAAIKIQNGVESGCYFSLFLDLKK
ncbi:lysophospholipase [Massarina eburnea CBS 473.64]|uniref:Lysophospholipase n=1 Tax=Massarina eburnea CBS 473.64 TaxID=1395130 RepID=A0A6A6S8Q4_9PLEO|nr:lysophospholipase [Massarina eburnea CBS 473.64]